MLGVLVISQDLKITDDEIKAQMTGVFSSALTGMILASVFLCFAKSIGMNKKDQKLYSGYAKEL